MRDYNFIFTIGAGSIFSTIDDLKKWIKSAFYTDLLIQSSKTKKILIKFNLEGDIWGHQGELPGFQSILLVNFSSKKNTIILSNHNLDSYGFLTEVSDNAGLNINSFEQRGGIDGLLEELDDAFSKNPYLMPVNIAIDLLNQVPSNS